MNWPSCLTTGYALSTFTAYSRVTHYLIVTLIYACELRFVNTVSPIRVPISRFRLALMRIGPRSSDWEAILNGELDLRANPR